MEGRRYADSIAVDGWSFIMLFNGGMDLLLEECFRLVEGFADNYGKI